MQAPFQNTQIDLDDIPSQVELHYSRMEKSYLTYGILFSFIFWVAVILILFFGKGFVEFAIPQVIEYLLWPVLIFLLIGTMGYSYFSFFKEGYALRQKDIVYKHGLFWRSIATIPFSRIQHCEVKEGPIQRLFGLASLHIYTAGGNSSDIDIPGLNPERANELKQFVLTKIKSEEEE